MSVWGDTFHDLDSLTQFVDRPEASHESAASAVELLRKISARNDDHLHLVSNVAVRRVRTVELSTFKREN